MTNKTDYKKTAKYVVNILNMLNALLVGLIPIWNIPYGDKVQATLVVISGVISTYLIGEKVVKKKEGN